MRKLVTLIIGITVSIASMGQPFGLISDGESGLSVRAKLNNTLSYLDSLGIDIEFSVDADAWHYPWASGDKYIRLSDDFGSTWSDAIYLWTGDTIENLAFDTITVGGYVITNNIIADYDTTGFVITESQIADLQDYLLSESDPVYADDSASIVWWNDTTTYIATHTMLADSASELRTDINALPTFLEVRSEISDSIAGVGGADLWTEGTSGRIYYEDGVVGIGTAAPSTAYDLHVAGKSLFQDNLLLQNGGTVVMETDGNNIKLPQLPNVVTDKMVFYNSTTGTLTYGDTISGSGAGATTFTGLTDTPSSYSGQAGNYVRVNSGETALEFASGTGSWTSDTYGITYSSGNVGIGAASSSTFALGVAENSTTFAISALNNNAGGDGFRIGTASTTGTDRIIDAYSTTGDVFSARADGTIYMPNIGTAKKANVLFYDTSNGLITYGDTTGFGGSAGTMVYPGAGIAVSTGSAWGTSITDNSTNWNAAYGWGDHSTEGYLTANQSITLSGDVTGSGTTAITTTIGNDAVEAGMLNDNIISGQVGITSGILPTDELLLSDGGVLRRIDVSVLQDYMQDSLTFGGGGEVTQLSDLSDVNTSTATNRNVLVADGTDWESRALTEADISDFGSYLETESDPKRVSSAAVTGTSTKTLTLTLADASTVTAQFTDMVGEVGEGDDWGSQTVVSDATLTGTGVTGNELKVDTTVISTLSQMRSDVSDSIGAIDLSDYVEGPASLSESYNVAYFNNSATDIAESNLAVNTTHGGLTNTINQSGAASIKAINSNSSGGLALSLQGGVGSASNIAQFNDYNNNPRFSFRGDGALFAPDINVGTTDTVLYWDDENGEITRGLAPSGGSGDNKTVQSLSGTGVTLNVSNGLNAKITVSANTTVTITNADGGDSGNITVTNPATSYTLNVTISGATKKTSPVLPTSSTNIVLSGDSKIDVISWYYDGTYIILNGTLGYE